jgi:hypothetical protein
VVVRRKTASAIVLLAVAPFLVAEAYGHRHELTHADGIAYLDMSDTVQQGRWRDLPNAHWSPLYPVLLAVARLLAPSLDSELHVAHALQVGLFLAALLALAYYASALSALTRARTSDLAATHAGLAQPALLALALSAGAVILMETIGLARLTPDLLLCVFIFLSAAFALRMRAEPSSLWYPIAFGLSAGLGYLSKAFLFPMAFVWLFTTWWSLRRAGLRRRGVGIAGATFALIASPWIAVLSTGQGKLTFSESARLNVLWMQNGLPWVNWQGEAGPQGTPLHAPRRLHREPEVFEFAQPIQGTYPLWNDPTYWNAGAVAKPTLRGTGRIAGQSAWSLLKLLLGLGAPAMAIFALCVLQRGVRAPWREAWHRWLAFLPPVIAVGAYVIAWVEPRYVGPFLALLAVSAMDVVWVPTEAAWRSASAAIVTAGIGFCALLCVQDVAPEIREAVSGAGAPMHLTARHALGALGREGSTEPIAVVDHGKPFPEGFYWARYLRSRIVALVVSRGGIGEWAGDDEAIQSVRRTLRSAGVRWLFSMSRPAGAAGEDWRVVGDSGLYALPLK